MTDPNPRAEAMYEALLQIIGHLGAIVSQAIPSDDQIIVGHARDALAIAETARLCDRAYVRASSPYLNRPLRTLEQAKAEAGR